MFDLGEIFAVNFLLAVLSIPFLWGLVPRNRFYGFRIPATLRDDRVWYIMNRRVAREMIVAGFALAFSAAMFDRVGLDTAFGRTLLSIVTLMAVTGIMMRAWIAANRLARQKQAPPYWCATLHVTSRSRTGLM